MTNTIDKLIADYLAKHFGENTKWDTGYCSELAFALKLVLQPLFPNSQFKVICAHTDLCDLNHAGLVFCDDFGDAITIYDSAGGHSPDDWCATWMYEAQYDDNDQTDPDLLCDPFIASYDHWLDMRDAIEEGLTAVGFSFFFSNKGYVEAINILDGLVSEITQKGLKTE